MGFNLFFDYLAKYIPLIFGAFGIVVYIFVIITFCHKEFILTNFKGIKIQLLLWAILNTVSQSILIPGDDNQKYESANFWCYFQVVGYDLSLSTIIAFDACFVLVSYLSYLHPQLCTVHYKKFSIFMHLFIYCQIPLVILFKLGYTIEIAYLPHQDLCLVPIGKYFTFLSTLILYAIYMVIYIVCLALLRKYLKTDAKRNVKFITEEQAVVIRKKLRNYIIVFCITLPPFFFTRICGFILQESGNYDYQTLFDVSFSIWCLVKGAIPIVAVVQFGMVNNPWEKIKDMINCCGCFKRTTNESITEIQPLQDKYNVIDDSSVDSSLGDF